MTPRSIENHGPLITATDYWQSDLAAAGKMIVSCNAGAIRCLLPPGMHDVLGELRRAKCAIASRGDRQGTDALEILWDDGSDAPHTWLVTGNSCLGGMPGDPGDSQWIITCWVERRGEPHKALERPCHWRRG